MLRKFSRARVVVLALAFGFVPVFLATQSAQAQTFTELYSFKGATDGATPKAGLIMDATGNLYGTTYSGGDLSCGNGYGCGAVFKLTPSNGGWAQSVLYGFKGLSSKDGNGPFAGLVRDAAGNLYGTTYFGGTSHGSCKPSGC